MEYCSGLVSPLGLGSGFLFNVNVKTVYVRKEHVTIINYSFLHSFSTVCVVYFSCTKSKCCACKLPAQFRSNIELSDAKFWPKQIHVSTPVICCACSSVFQELSKVIGRALRQQFGWVVTLRDPSLEVKINTYHDGPDWSRKRNFHLMLRALKIDP